MAVADILRHIEPSSIDEARLTLTQQADATLRTFIGDMIHECNEGKEQIAQGNYTTLDELERLVSEA